MVRNKIKDDIHFFRSKKKTNSKCKGTKKNSPKKRGRPKGCKTKKKHSRKPSSDEVCDGKGKKQGSVSNGKKRGDVFSLMHAHLKKLPAVILKKCKSTPYHRFLDSKTVSAQVCSIALRVGPSCSHII